MEKQVNYITAFCLFVYEICTITDMTLISLIKKIVIYCDLVLMRYYFKRYGLIFKIFKSQNTLIAMLQRKFLKLSIIYRKNPKDTNCTSISIEITHKSIQHPTNTHPTNQLTQQTLNSKITNLTHFLTLIISNLSS